MLVAVGMLAMGALLCLHMRTAHLLCSSIVDRLEARPESYPVRAYIFPGDTWVAELAVDDGMIAWPELEHDRVAYVGSDVVGFVGVGAAVTDCDCVCGRSARRCVCKLPESAASEGAGEQVRSHGSQSVCLRRSSEVRGSGCGH